MFLLKAYTKLMRENILIILLLQVRNNRQAKKGAVKAVTKASVPGSRIQSEINDKLNK